MQGGFMTIEMMKVLIASLFMALEDEDFDQVYDDSLDIFCSAGFSVQNYVSIYRAAVKHALSNQVQLKK